MVVFVILWSAMFVATGAPTSANPGVVDLVGLAHQEYLASTETGSGPALGLRPYEPATQDQPEPHQSVKPFGQAESRYWTIHLGGGTDFTDNHLARTGVGVGYFIADDISLDLELNLLYFNEVQEDAAGVNLNLLMRWHFYHDDARRWSLYADGGAGLMVTTEDVPAEGSSFNFTPQLGIGASVDLSDDMRLFAGLRWHHVSNANVYERNPGRDALLLYAMIGFPF